MDPSAAFYVHGTSATEQRRLSSLNDLINDACLRELNLRGDERIVDFGCGLMQLSRAMARTVRPRGGAVVGIERDPEQRAEALRQARDAGEIDLVELRAGDAFDPPLRPEEWGTFDVAHSRFLLEHVPQPQRVVDSMVRSVKAGGRIVLADDDHDTLRMSPDVPAFEAVWRAYMRTYEEAGNDPVIGRRLVGLLHRAGARPTRNTFLFFGSCAGHETWPLITANLLRIIEGAKAAILRMERVTTAGFVTAVRDLAAWSARPDAALWYSICWAEGVRPP